MQIRVQAPNEHVPATFLEHVEETTKSALAQFAGRLTRVEVHLRDTNAGKGGVDKRCVLEARPRGLDPVAADHEAETFQEAFRGGLDKLEKVLERRFGKLSARRNSDVG